MLYGEKLYLSNRNLQKVAISLSCNISMISYDLFVSMMLTSLMIAMNPSPHN